MDETDEAELVAMLQASIGENVRGKLSDDLKRLFDRFNQQVGILQMDIGKNTDLAWRGDQKLEILLKTQAEARDSFKALNEKLNGIESKLGALEAQVSLVKKG